MLVLVVVVVLGAVVVVDVVVGVVNAGIQPESTWTVPEIPYAPTPCPSSFVK